MEHFGPLSNEKHLNSFQIPPMKKKVNHEGILSLLCLSFSLSLWENKQKKKKNTSARLRKKNDGKTATSDQARCTHKGF